MIAKRPSPITEFETLPRFVGLLRKNGSILAKISVLREPLPYQPPQLGMAPYAIIESPLAELDKGLFAKKSRVLKAWSDLEQVTAPDAGTLTNILIILMESTLVISDSVAEPALPDLNPVQQETKPTAAHPRAFKGTKSKPPKRATLAHNLQPLLFSERGVNYLLAELGAYREKALTQLKSLGYEDSKLEHINGKENSFAVHEHTQAYEAVLARLASFDPKSGIGAWIKLLTTRPEEQRIALAVTSITTGASDMDVAAVEKYLSILDSLCADDAELVQAFWILMDAVANGHDDDYVLNGFRIQHGETRPLRFERIEHSVRNLDWRLLLDIHTPVASGQSYSYHWPSAYYLWKTCGEAPFIMPLLPTIACSNLSYPTIEKFLHFIAYSKYLDNDPVKTIDAKRMIAAKYAPQLLNALINTTPQYRQRCVIEMQEYFYTPDTAECVEDNMATFLLMLARLCAPPFSTKLDLLGTACGLTEEFGMSTLADASDKVLLALEAQCNKTQALLTSALSKLCKALPDLAHRALHTDTTKLCKVARLFGTLPLAKERLVLKNFLAHPLMCEPAEISALSVTELFALIEPIAFGGVPSPFSAKMTSYLRGEVSLSDEQVARGHKEALTRLDAIRLDLLRKLIHAQLTAQVPSEMLGETTLHAMQIYNRSDRNRRAFKSFLKAHFNGQPDYRENHPLSRRWIAEHPKLDVNLFRQGLIMCEDIEGFGPVTITVEQDPFEALKLGTYVSTCFSMNGICNYSALAVVLDINKRVLYARNAKGKVLARQIVVWDEADLLEAFKVYPEKAALPLKHFFRKYDLAFAEALGTNIFAGDSWADGAPDVVTILSDCWWDDGSWDVSELEEEEEEEEKEDEELPARDETGELIP